MIHDVARRGAVWRSGVRYFLTITAWSAFIALFSLYAFRFFEPRQVHYGNVCLQGGNGYFVRFSDQAGYYEIQKFLSPGSVVFIGHEFETQYEMEHYAALGEVWKGQTYIDIAASSESELDRVKRQIMSGCNR